ncbi:thiol-disulfide oxidoreductase DCC family protein [Cohnella cholangitidis]|uniref:Thiol-disulfide oxidoreductase DCC family protein n=1 Tax=Cohnella cholangitidis TaxID=2598458 RepID=A0A7G5BTB1_9BACL|nr:thiol-disulfide oxidoreductase DCC family protein [Cohnella cholangitidis]QMV40195.1 thiol-disulfide oxidoreductase DCC family protein [Cohnella cholangitidis]
MNGTANDSKAPVILLIDGECNMCHGISRFVIRRDPKAKFRFASLQSNTGQRMLQEGGLSASDLDTVVMVDNGRYDTKSTAALRLFRKLGGAWALLYIGIIVPKAIRDRVYDMIARRRYRWFGRNESCLIPTADVRKRFIED